MFRFLLRRLVLIPVILAAANFFGFYFAFSIAPIVSTSNPYAQGNLDVPPVIPEYLNYLSHMVQRNFGTAFNGENVIETAAWIVNINKDGLYAFGTNETGAP